MTRARELADVPSTGLEAGNVTYTPSATGGQSRTLEEILASSAVNVKDFGATGNGSSNDTGAVQAAIDSLGAAGGTVYFPPGTYRIARTLGIDDRWGLKITGSNVTLLGNNATLRRFDTNITNILTSYPILFLGTPDSNTAAPTRNIKIKNLNFQGEDTRHSTSGNVLQDYRYAIWFRNTDTTEITDCTFTNIDSGALSYMGPYSYSYRTTSFVNTTKNYRSRITNCNFVAQPHTVPTRALLHAINWGGLDFGHLDSCYFEWCDDCVAGEGSYNRPTDTEDDTWTPTNPAWTLGPVKRCGRSWVCTNNRCYNSSEHAFYPAAMDVVVSNNHIWTDEPTICTGDQIKIRSRNAVVSGNIVSNFRSGGISVNEPAYNVSITGNTVNLEGTAYTGGAFDINSDTLSQYVTARPWFQTFDPMSNIVFDGNVIVMDPGAQSASGQQGAAVRIYTASSDANFPEGQITNVKISNNVFKNHNIGVFLIGPLMRAIDVTGNTFVAKDFQTSGFSSGTTLNTHSVITAFTGSLTSVLTNMTFNNNKVWGATYLVATHLGTGTAGSYAMPNGMQNNSLNYVKNLKGSDVAGVEAITRFTGNVGQFFLDRTWGGYGLENSLSAATGGNSSLRYVSQYDGTTIRFYTDDSGGYITL